MQGKRYFASTIHIETGYTSLHGYRLHYRVAGAGSPLVLIHGFGVSGHVWNYVLPYLAQEHRVFIVDLPGYGRSYRHARVTWQLRDMAPLLIEWLEQLHLSSFHLVGHSMGGAIAIHLAATMPEKVKSLTLIDAAGMPFHTSLSALAARSARSMVQVGNGSYPLPLVRDVLRPRMRLLWQGAMQISQSDFRTEITTLKMPILILWGEDDILVPISLGYALYAALPRALFIALAHCGHRPMLAQPEMVSGILLAFFEDHDC